MKKRILIIEDNETNLELMVYLLEEFGYTLFTATDGEAGLATARKESPDLVLCDIQVPKLDGYGVVKAMKADARLRKIPIIAVTALAMVGDREKGLAAGFDGYISKPIEAKSFIEQVAQFLGLPPDTRPNRSPTEGPAPTPPRKKAAILVIDDLAANAKLLESLLEPLGYTIVICTSGMTDAMALARKHRPVLIISDVFMHEGDGYQLCEALKTDPRLKTIPLILITSTFSDETSRQKGLALGAARYLFRPIDSRELLREIKDCLAGRK